MPLKVNSQLRGEVSLVEQDKIDYVSKAYFEPIFNKRDMMPLKNR